LPGNTIKSIDDCACVERLRPIRENDYAQSPFNCTLEARQSRNTERSSNILRLTSYRHMI
jgi:hypothetical protein